MRRRRSVTSACVTSASNGRISAATSPTWMLAITPLGRTSTPDRTLDSEGAPEQLSFDVLALAYHDDVHVGRPVGLPRQGVGVARVASPHVRAGGREHDAVGIGPVVVQAASQAAAGHLYSLKGRAADSGRHRSRFLTV